MIGDRILVRQGARLVPGTVVSSAEHTRTPADIERAKELHGVTLPSKSTVYFVDAINPDTFGRIKVQLGDGDYGVNWCHVGETLEEAAAAAKAPKAPVAPVEAPEQP